MAFPIKRKKTWSEKEISSMFKEYHGKPPFKEYSRTGARTTFKIPEQLHTKGTLVEYKNDFYVITKITKKGIYVNKFTKRTDDLTKLSKKKEFISEEKIRKGKVYPYYAFTLL